MTEALEKCENCLKDFPESKIATHFGYCRRNIKRCAQCGEMYDINCQQEHEEEFHKKANCQFCKKEFGVADLQKHKNNCTQRTKFCEYCELNVPLNQFPSHLKACESRTKACEKCRKPIANKDFLVHLTTCRGMVEEPRSYDQFINNQRSKEAREEIRQPIRKVEYQPQQRRQQEYRRRQVPTNGGFNNYVAPNKEKPTVTTVPTVPSVQVPSRYQPTSITSNKSPVYSVNPTYNPRQGLTTNQPKDQQIRSRNPVPANRNQIKSQLRTDLRRNDQNTNNYPYQNQQYSNKQGENIKRQTNTYVSKPVITPISNVTYGQKNEPQKTPSYVPTTSYNPVKKQQPAMKKQEKVPTFDPREYGGYSDEIPQEILRNDFKHGGHYEQDFEDEELQKVLIESINQTKKGLPKNLPKQFANEDLMNASFYQDLDVARQNAAYQQAQRNKKNSRR